MNAEDREIGMDRPITRRDFISGVSVAVGGALVSSTALQAFGPASGTGAPGATTADQPFAPELAADYYPPARYGLRGAHPGSFEAAHAARDGQAFANPEDTRETYDLIVVGGGLSGLAAAYYFRKKAGPSARILVLDNHDDFGGHAKRNEYVHNGRTLMVTGGSAYMVAPSTWTYEAIQLIKDLGIEKGHPTHKVDRELYRSLGLGPGVFFRKEKYGQDTLVSGGSLTNPTPEFLAKTPLSPQVQADLVRLIKGSVDYMPGLSREEKIAKLQRMSYRDYLLNVAKVHPDVPPLLGGVWCLGTDTATAWFAFYRYRPGFAGLGIERPHGSPESPEHTADDFRLPAGNSDIARLIVRALIPDALPPGSFADVQTKRVNYAKLDDPASPARIRLNSIAVRVQHAGAGAKAMFEADTREVDVTYVRGGKAYRARGKDVVLACNNAMIPFLCPELPEAQKKALHLAVRAVNQQTNVLLRDFKAFADLKVSNVGCPSSFYGGFSLGATMALGDLQTPRDPSDPTLVSFNSGANSGLLSNETMVSELCGGSPPPAGTPMQDQFRAVRMALLVTPFETFERAIRTQMARALAGSGFDPARDIAAITVNRWPHGFAMSRNSLFDPDTPETEAPHLIARQRFGHIAIANSDASGIDLVQTAFDEAFRAVTELMPRHYGYFSRI
jgi:spermidine dehydrogenase